MIDFEKKFSAYLHEYMHTCKAGEAELEERLPGLYLEWLDTPMDWLAGRSPNAYFASMEAGKLTETFGRYLLAGMALPAPLLSSIADRSGETYPLLVSLMKNYEGEAADALKTAVVRLIDEMELAHPYPYYIGVIAAAGEAGDFSEACAAALCGACAAHLDSVLAAYESAQSRYAADCFLDILAGLPFDERIYEHVLERFLLAETGRAFYASLLGRLGSEKALPYLKEALRQDGMGYYDYCAVKNALEALGGEIDIERDFSGDKDYETLIDREY